MSSLSRDFVADIQVRADGTGRTVHGIVVPYGQVARVSDGGPAYQEMFAPGAFARDIQARAGNFSRVKLLMQHDAKNPVGVATDLREDSAGLYGSFRVSNVEKGNEAIELLRDGVLDSFSVGFRAGTQERRDGVTVRTKASLREASLVTFPAYEGALVAGLRSLAPDDAALAQQLLTVLAVADAQLDPIVDALCAADGALDMAQAVIAQILAVPNPDPVDGEDMGDMEMSSNLTSLARRLDAAISARASTTSSDLGEPDPREHSGRLIVARNNFRAALIQRGIRA